MFDISLLDTAFVLIAYVHIWSVIHSLYNHRGQQHNSIIFNKTFEKVIRAFLWIGPGVANAAMTAQHRHHHHYSDTPSDFFAPTHHSMWETVVVRYFKTLYFYLTFKKLHEGRVYLIEQYKVKNQKDFFVSYPRIGRFIFLSVNCILFGYYGLVLTALFYTIAIFSFVVLGDCISHLCGYRNFNTNDNSYNFFPIGILLGGEELHHNHHKYPHRAKFSVKWWEVDISWAYLKLFLFLKLATLPANRTTQAA